MTGAPSTPDAVPRADAPRELYLRRGFFPFAQTHLRGLPVEFWGLALYLFLSLSAIDEERKIRIAGVGLRMIIGSLTIALAAGRIVAGNARLPPGFRHPTTFWLLAFVFAGMFSMIWAFLPGYAIDAFKIQLTSAISFVLILMVVRTRRLLALTLLVFCAGIGAYLLLSFWEWRGGRLMYAQGVVRMVGYGTAYADPNSFAATLAFAMPIMIWVFVHTERLWIRLCVVLYTGLSMIAILNTSSRSGLVLLALSFGWAFCFLPRGRTKRLAVILGLAGMAALSAKLSEAQVERIQSIFSERTYRKEESTHGRVEGYVVAWKMFKERPVFGVGPGNWSEYRQRRIDGDKLMPHNLAGQLLATRGATGTIAFFFFLLATARLGLRTYLERRRTGGRWDAAVSKLCNAMCMTYLLLLVSGLGAHNLTRPNWYWCSALMLVAVTCKSEEDEAEAEASVPLTTEPA